MPRHLPAWSAFRNTKEIGLEVANPSKKNLNLNLVLQGARLKKIYEIIKSWGIVRDLLGGLGR